MPFQHLTASEFGLETQKFLYACAYWIILADEQLTMDEQNWMKQEFDESHYNGWLLEFGILNKEEFLEQFDILSGSLPFEDQQKIFPIIHEWLVECCYSDGSIDDNEKAVIKDLCSRIHLKEMLD